MLHGAQQRAVSEELCIRQRLVRKTRLPAHPGERVRIVPHPVANLSGHFIIVDFREKLGIKTFDEERIFGRHAITHGVAVGIGQMYHFPTPGFARITFTIEPETLKVSGDYCTLLILRSRWNAWTRPWTRGPAEHEDGEWGLVRSVRCHYLHTRDAGGVSDTQSDGPKHLIREYYCIFTTFLFSA